MPVRICIQNHRKLFDAANADRGKKTLKIRIFFSNVHRLTYEKIFCNFFLYFGVKHKGVYAISLNHQKN